MKKFTQSDARKGGNAAVRSQARAGYLKGSVKMKDLRFKFSIFNKFYFGIYNKVAAETAALQKNKFVSIHKNPFLQGYVIEIIL